MFGHLTVGTEGAVYEVVAINLRQSTTRPLGSGDGDYINDGRLVYHHFGSTLRKC